MQDRQKAIDTLRDSVEAEVKRKEALERLQANDDYKMVFEEYLLKDLIVLMAKRKGDPNAMHEDVQNDLDAQIMAMGRLDSTLKNIIRAGDMAPQRLAEINDTEKAFLAEGEHE